MRRDAAAFDALHAGGPHPSGLSLACYGLDGRMEALALWSAPAGTMVVFDERIGAFLCRGSGKRTTIIARPRDRAARVALLRAVREIASAAFVGGGGVVLHAAALEVRGRGVVIAGEKRAGKTTLLLHLLTLSRAAFVAGDRSAIDRDGVLRGMPTIVNVRGTTLDVLPQLAARFEASSDHHRFSSSEDADHPAGPRTSWSLTPAQLVRVLGVQRTSGVPVGAVVFPMQRETSGGVELRRLSDDEANARLQRAMFDSGAAEPSFFDAVSRDVSVRSVYPCFEWVLGRDAYAGGRVEALLDEVLGAGR